MLWYLEEGVKTMEYIAHIDKERIQTVKEHLEGTAKISGDFAEKFGKEDWGYCCGMLHDIGKYSIDFQKRILGESNRRVDHSTASARVCAEKGEDILFWNIAWKDIMQDCRIMGVILMGVMILL